MTIAKTLRVFSRILALGSLALLVACAGADDTSEISSNAPATEIEAVSPEIANVAPPETAVPDVDAPAPDELIGLKPVELSEAFGTASLVRKDRGTEIWQYRARECVLFLFLYTKSSNNADNALSVRHIDVRGDQKPTECIKSIVRERGSRSHG